MFREYYANDFCLRKSFPVIEKREFGFASFEGYMLRHKGFQNKDELSFFLRDSVPRDAYLSCAFYENPEAEMEKKGWVGADLIFDIDADHVPTSCGKVHDEWTCGDCGFVGKGVAPERCPVCGSEKFEVGTWPCEVCLASARAETAKLLDMLTRDFGFLEKEVRVFFSGHRGYHVHVENENVKMLDAIARKEIVDYISGLGFDAIFQGEGRKSWKRTPVVSSSPLSNFGWNWRIARGVHDFILNARKEDLAGIGVKRNIAESILKNKDAILKSWEEGAGILSAVKGLGFETWRKIIEFCVRNQAAKIDTVVTTDIHRLIRIPETLHGKTGLKKVEFPASAIGDFDPFKDAVAFKKGAVTIFVYDAPKFRLGEGIFGPYKNQKVELPTAAAMLLICRDKAEVVE